eukprot:CAMPEP_0204617372 /NCGR_PEP_ID=MMETSP0717-20131115/4375_1 /ASSEMBLY_ACC=CAM_ASM_000666 /TAXON_ID=230516 /ORGANISM="Chaetoceros curvisetus" /LENGTH=187 /DNA_ID=CAMNT_0051630891 /DNA_START=42 /DNA_END=605 /DNA_ORIENTATION=-
MTKMSAVNLNLSNSLSASPSTSSSSSSSLLASVIDDEGTNGETILNGKRVQVKIRYSATPGLRPYFLTVAKKIKMHNPDVIVEKVILPAIDDDAELDDTIFEVMVDGKIVIGKPRTKWTNVRRSGKDEIDNNKMFGMSFFVCMEDINVAIGKARKKKRPNATVYAPEDRARSIGLEMLKGSDDADDE